MAVLISAQLSHLIEKEATKIVEIRQLTLFIFIYSEYYKSETSLQQNKQKKQS